jgi:predicted porin
MDLGYSSVTKVSPGAARVSGLQNGGLSTSRLGFRGTEDLGGGLKAKFNLEAEILADTGAQSSTPEALFARASWVGLESAQYGSVQLGRMNHFTYDQAIAGDAFGANNFGGLVAATVGFYARIENAVTYKTPVVNGFQAGAQTGTRTQFGYNGTLPSGGVYGEVAGETDKNRVNGAFASYAAGPLQLGASWGELKDNSAEPVKLSEITNVFARYDFGRVKLFTGYTNQKNNSSKVASTTTGATGDINASTGVLKVQSYYLGATAPITAKVNVMANAIQVKNTLNGTGKNQEPRVFALGATYSLSKRTTLYALAAMSDQDNGSTQRIANSGKFAFTNQDTGAYTNGVAPLANGEQSGYMVGIRHSF